jgi:hypothetical protein
MTPDRQTLPRVLDEHDHLVPVDPKAIVQPLERWIRLSGKSAVIGSDGNPLGPSWATRDGLIVHHANRSWTIGLTRAVSARLYNAAGRHRFFGRGHVTVEGLVEIEDREYFRFAFDPTEGDHAEAFHRFLRLALSEHTKPQPPAPPAHRTVGRRPANDAG